MKLPLIVFKLGLILFGFLFRQRWYRVAFAVLNLLISLEAKFS